jgi:sulfite reductase alpha subunit-like flavoprotein
LRQRLLEEYPLPGGLEPIPDHVLLDPKWLLDFANPPSNAPTMNDSAPTALRSRASVPDWPPEGLLPIKNSLVAEVLANTRVTGTSHWQDVRHLTIEIPGYHAYVPGDVLAIHPKNFPCDVDEFLNVTHWAPIADRPLKFVPSSQTPNDSALPIPNFSTDTTLTLRTLLTNNLDIMSIPRRSFFAQLAHFTTDEFQRERLLEFTNPEYIDELYDYTTRPRRSILEVLQEFETVRLPWQRICSIIPFLRGRQFSIASAQSPSASIEDKTRIELLIAIVKYRTVIKRIRQGVCTRYIASLQSGQKISVILQKGGLRVTKAEIGNPVVMIGPGTGVAPMRSLIHQRNHWRKELQEDTGKTSKDILFFGCRNAESDYFFKDEWEKLKEAGLPLEIYAAFSRDQVRYSRPSHRLHRRPLRRPFVAAVP